MTAADYLPSTPRPSLQELSTAAHGCQGCDLYKHATQTVFGEGATRAEVMLVGEQPGDREDLEGEPFVGPAGRLLDQALERAGIDRDRAYVTNAVKHFKWEARGKRRIHRPPNKYEIGACKPWLQAELLAVEPKLVIAMGGTAARALLERDVKIMTERGQVVRNGHRPPVAITVHPSSILRSRDDEERRVAMEAFVEDLRHALSEAGRDTGNTDD